MWFSPEGPAGCFSSRVSQLIKCVGGAVSVLICKLFERLEAHLLFVLENETLTFFIL